MSDDDRVTNIILQRLQSIEAKLDAEEADGEEGDEGGEGGSAE